MAVDLETVHLMGTYRVGFIPPRDGSLAPGELYIQVATPDQGPPWIWIGQMDDKSAALLVPGPDSIAPVNLDTPFVSQTADLLSCTMGNWLGQPDTYSYQWEIGGVPSGADADTYTIVAGDIGQAAVCTVSATNVTGTGTAPPSNSVIVIDPAA